MLPGTLGWSISSKNTDLVTEIAASPPDAPTLEITNYFYSYKICYYWTNINDPRLPANKFITSAVRTAVNFLNPIIKP